MLIDQLKMVRRSLSQVRSIYILTTIFLVGLSIYSFIQIQRLFNASTLIRQSSEVRECLRSISSAILYAESNKRGFLLTGDSSLLYRRDKGLSELQTEHQLLTQFLKNNPEQNTNLALLATAINHKSENIKKSWNEVGPLPVDSSIRANIEEGVQTFDSISLCLDRMNTIERRMYESRSYAFSRLSLVTPIYIIVLFLGALLILYFSYFKINRELLESRKLHTVLKDQNQTRRVLGEELVAANKELAFQNTEKGERAAELNKALRELAYQNEENEKRAAELSMANLELGFQNETKVKLTGELIIANHELAFQNEENEKRAVELFNANKELQLFLNISSHDLQEPLRKIQISASRIEDADFNALSPKGKDHFVKMQEAAQSMQVLIDDLLTYSRTNTEEREFEFVDLSIIINDVKDELKEVIAEKNAVVEVTDHCEANIIPFQFRQLIYNMLSNALKFSIPDQPPHILISSCVKKGSDCNYEKLLPEQEYCHITIKDNGIGFEQEYSEKIFEVFQRLYGKEIFKGTGIGLAIVKKIVDNHNGFIVATSQLNQGANFDIYIPTNTNPQNG